MIARSVNAAADVIARAMENGRQTPAGWAMALDAACMLQTPEIAAELERLRRYVGSQQSREGELLATLGQYNLVDHPDAWDLGMAVISHLEGPHRPPTPEELEPGLLKLIEQLRARVSELEQLLAAKDRPADEFPILYTLTDKAVAEAGEGQ